MEFDNLTRELVSSTGYIKRKDGTLYADHSIFLGRYDDPSNYEEGNEEEFGAWVEEQTGGNQE